MKISSEFRTAGMDDFKSAVSLRLYVYRSLAICVQQSLIVTSCAAVSEEGDDLIIFGTFAPNYLVYTFQLINSLTLFSQKFSPLCRNKLIALSNFYEIYRPVQLVGVRRT